MTLVWASWLPRDAATPAATQRALEACIEGWAHDWFAGAPACVIGRLARLDGPRSELRKTIRFCCEGVEVSLGTKGLAALGALVLDVSTVSGTRTAEDTRLLEALGSDCLDGLKHQLSNLFGLGTSGWLQTDASDGDSGTHRIEVWLAGRTVTFAITLRSDRFADFVRSTLQLPMAKGRLGDGSMALGQTPIALSAALGGCQLSLAELSSMSVDDVIVLDSALADPRPLAVDGAALAKGACAVVQTRKGIALQIVEAPSK